VELFIAPCQDTNGGVLEGVTQSLRLRQLLSRVAAMVIEHPGVPFKTVAFVFRVWCDHVSEGKPRVRAKCWCTAFVHVEMGCSTMVRILIAHCLRNSEAPVASLRDVLFVSKFEHQLMADLGILRESEARLFHAFGKSEIGQAQCHKMESWCTRIGRQSGEFDEYLPSFHERTGPAMDEEERDRCR
jgi:hypothetical protein